MVWRKQINMDRITRFGLEGIKYGAMVATVGLAATTAQRFYEGQTENGYNLLIGTAAAVAISAGARLVRGMLEQTDLESIDFQKDMERVRWEELN